jgi:hypothetical protein
LHQLIHVVMGVALLDHGVGAEFLFETRDPARRVVSGPQLGSSLALVGRRVLDQ